MEANAILSKLQENIHRALKVWNETSVDSSPFDHLHLFRQAKLKGSFNTRRVTNEILLDALETLTIEHEDSANLLRQHFLDEILMQTIANRFNIGQSTAYRKQQEALHQLALIIQAKEAQARADYQSHLEKRLKLPPETHLYGIDQKFNNALDRLITLGTPWLMSIEGLGGIGKTALANALVRRSELIGRFHNIVWVSAKQRAFFPGIGLEDNISPALTVETLIDTLLEQLGQTSALIQSSQEKKVALTHLLKQNPTLIVIDNLETMVDYQTLLPTLWEIVTPSKVVLTSRHSLRAYPDVFCLTLAALNQTYTFHLIRHEATIRGLKILARVEDAQLEPIYNVVGGNPLALKLVIGQTAFLPLSQVLDNLKEAQGKSITDLYTYIYWQTWHMLDDVSRQTLQTMPLAQEGTLQQLQAITQLEPAELYQALQQLATLSLVQVDGDLEKRRYAIHRLTETFLLNEAITWPSSA